MNPDISETAPLTWNIHSNRYNVSDNGPSNAAVKAIGYVVMSVGIMLGLAFIFVSVCVFSYFCCRRKAYR